MGREEIFNSLTLEQMRNFKGRKWTLYGPDVIPMYVADPDFPVPLEIKKTIIDAVQEHGRLGYARDEEAKAAMAEKVTKRNGINAKPSDIMIIQGVTPAMWLAVRHACQPGDEVIVTNPMYRPFFTAVEANGAKLVYHNLYEEDGYKFDIDALNELVTEKTKLIMVCNPHNPCGRVLTKEELRGIGEVAVDHNLTIMVDELHEDIVLDGRKHISIASISPEIEERTITAFGFSKTYGIAGLQIGYIVATNKQIMENLMKVGRGIVRGATSLSMVAVPIMLDDTLKWWRESLVKHITKIRNLMERRFERIPGITCTKLEGTYIMFPNLSSYGKTSKEMADYLLKEAKVAVSEGSVFGTNGEGHVRMIIATSEEIINEALNRVERALSKLK